MRDGSFTNKKMKNKQIQTLEYLTKNVKTIYYFVLLLTKGKADNYYIQYSALSLCKFLFP